jgi:hypothetical protein
MEDNYIKPNNDAYFKKILPIRFNMQVISGDMPEFVLRGRWQIVWGSTNIRMTPPLFSVFPSAISPQQWDDLGKSQSKINIDSLQYKPMPPRPPAQRPDFNYLIFSRDRTAVVENPYFAQTPPVKGKDGVMIFIRGRGPLPDGWQVLGHTYAEVWADPAKLALYNSLFPPGKDGKPQPFGFFSGIEKEMVGASDRTFSAATTSPADILEFTYPELKK